MTNMSLIFYPKQICISTKTCVVLAFGYAFYVLFSLPVTYFLLLQAEKSGCILLFQQTLVWRTFAAHMEMIKDQKVGISSSRVDTA